MIKGRPIAIVSNDPEVTDLIEHCGSYKLIGIFDVDSCADTGGVPLLGSDDEWRNTLADHPDLQVALAADLPALKKKLLSHYGVDALVTLISPDAYVSQSARLSAGCIIQRGVKVLPNAQLGMACKVNVNATVHHDSVVGNYCTLAPGCQLLGNTMIEEEVFVGAGAIILPKVRVGKGTTVGAGAVVVKDVASDLTVVGVPARPVR